MLKNKSKFSSLIIGLSLMVGLSGCPDIGDNSTQTVDNQTIDKRATIQGGVFDAVTGARLGGDDLKLTLIQGTSDRSPSKLEKDVTKDLAGEYAFSDVPVNTGAGNITYKMVITKTGYQRFEGLVTYPVVGAVTTTDNIINLIRDVYLFPVGVTAPDVEVIVEYDQEPVVGATVILQQNAAGAAPQSATAETSANRLVATTGMLPTLTGTTDATGKATFAGTTLVLGGAYTPVVLPIKHEGVQLARNTTPATFIAGTANSPIVVAMADAVPGGQDDGIFVVFSSNRGADDLTATGVVTLVFNRAVSIQTNNATATNPFTAALVNAGAAVLNGANTNTSVTPSLSADGLTLTLTPNFTTAPATTDSGLAIRISGGQVTVSGDEGGQGTAVFDVIGQTTSQGEVDAGTHLGYLDGAPLNDLVNVIAISG